MNTAATLDAIQEQLAAVRTALNDDVRSVAADARTLTDWRHHFREHPLLFSGAAAALGFVLIPRRRRETGTVGRISGTGPGEAADANQSVERTDATVRSGDGLPRALLQLGVATLVEEAVIFGVRRGRELLSQQAAHDGAEARPAEPKQPVSSHTPPDVIPNGKSTPSRPETGSADLQQAVKFLRKYARGLATDHPKTSLIAAGSAGVVLGWLWKRR